MSESHFHKGDHVEVIPAVHGGAYYPATVLRPTIKDRAHNFIEYQTPNPNPLKEIVLGANVRPAPPRELHRFYKVGDEVDAFRDDGWWRGRVMEILENSKYLVEVEVGGQGFEFDHFDLRLYREWDDGSWVPPVFPQEEKSGEVVKSRRITIKIRDKKRTVGAGIVGGAMEYDLGLQSAQLNLRCNSERDEQSLVSPLAKELNSAGVVNNRKIRFKVRGNMEAAAKSFKKGTLVEVSSDDEGYKGAWYTAKVVDYIGGDKYLVEYLSLLTDDRTKPLREEALASYIRPFPPPLPPVVQFKRFQKVDAWFNDGWWEGSISEVLTGWKYVVYFGSTNEKL